MKVKSFSRFKRQLILLMLTHSTLTPCAYASESLTFNVNGKPVTVVLAEHPVITYTSNTLHIKTNTTAIDLPVGEIEFGFFQDVASSIQEIDGYSDEIRFSSLQKNSHIEVFSIAGKKLMDVNVNDNGVAIVRLKHIPKGPCIIKSDSRTIKIINK